MYGISSSRNDDHQPHQPALGLALLAEEQHVVLGEDGDVELRDHGVVVADDAGVQLVAGLQLGQKVVVNLLLDGLRLPAAGAELGQRRWFALSVEVDMTARSTEGRMDERKSAPTDYSAVAAAGAGMAISRSTPRRQTGHGRWRKPAPRRQ